MNATDKLSSDLVFPIPLLSGLMTSKRKKIGLAVVFGMGIITIIVSVGRFVTMLYVHNDISICTSPFSPRNPAPRLTPTRYMGNRRDLYFSNDRRPHRSTPPPPKVHQPRIHKQRRPNRTYKKFYILAWQQQDSQKACCAGWIREFGG